MPLYEYECQHCGYRFEQLEKYETKELPCPVKLHREKFPCPGVAVRVPSAGSFKFNCSMPTYQKPKEG